jgi:serine/threonine-protein kinase
MRSAEAIDLEASTQLGNYEILGVLGRGDMGVVDKARQLKANRVVALKMMLSSRHASMQERFAFRSRPRP